MQTVNQISAHHEPKLSLRLLLLVLLHQVKRRNRFAMIHLYRVNNYRTVRREKVLNSKSNHLEAILRS